MYRYQNSESIGPCKFMCLLQEEQVPQLRGSGGGRQPRVPGDRRGLRDGGDREEDVLPVQEEAQILAVRVQGRQVGGHTKHIHFTFHLILFAF